MKGLCVEPRDRWQTMGQLLEKLREVRADETVKPAPAAKPKPKSK
jgi:hypothetical protein